jgi:hypothetical protein
MSGIDHIAHDPVARQSLHRQTGGKPCAWCGRKDRMTFFYVVEPDDSLGCESVPASAKAFCNLDCRRSYLS